MNAAVGERLWWKAETGKVHVDAFAYVRRIEMQYGDVFDRFVKLEALYDPNSPDADGEAGHVDENVIAAGVDTVAAMVATAEIRARFLTDGADWGQSRRARQLEFYSEELQADLKILPKCRRAFKEAVKKGTGLTKSHIVFGKVRVDLVAVENCVVDPAESRDGREPRQFHQWDVIDADELAARYPKYETEIERARGRNTQWPRPMNRWPNPANDVIVLYSWRKPIGVRGEKGYRPGRETVCIDGCDLYDEKWHDEDFPFAVMTWSDRMKSWYGISGAERIMGIQWALNKRNWQIDRALDQNAVLTTFIRPADAAMPTKTTRIGQFAIVKGDWPQRPAPPAVHAETYQDRIRLRDSGLNELGVNQMAAHASKPAGIDSGRAIEEYTNATTVRFASQEIGFEQLVLDTIWCALMRCRELGDKAPKMVRRGRFGARKIAWKDADPREIKVQMKAASNSTRMPWGRAQTAIELAQAGLVSTDSARRMLDHLDIDQELSLYMAALESIEGDLDDMADGMVVVPEPFTNAAMAVWRGQNEYLKWQRNSAPEPVLEVLRQYIELAADIVSQAQQPINDNAQPGMPAGAAAPGPMPIGPAPGGAQPNAALAPEAMNTLAS